MRRKFCRISFFIILISLCTCRNPFFPPTGVPVEAKGARELAKEVIEKLMTSYDTKNLNLFTSLFEVSEFKFYVPPGFNDSAIVKQHVALDSSLDKTNYPYIFDYYNDVTFYYWGFDKEKRSHEKMFGSATTINFTKRMQIEDITPTKINYDTSDTTEIEVVISGGARVEIVALPYFKGAINIKKQVFYIRIDKKTGTKKIIKWFDLN